MRDTRPDNLLRAYTLVVALRYTGRLLAAVTYSL